jgi:2-phospho-L-lactate guanylyltransferase (CobY/MobA/RfbA family)
VGIEVSVRASYDIDDPADISMALVYGLGAATSAVLAELAAAGAPAPR